MATAPIQTGTSGALTQKGTVRSAAWKLLKPWRDGQALSCFLDT